MTVRKRKRVGFSTRGKFWFDKGAASGAVDFIENFCVHIEGELAGEAFLLEDWERFLIEETFGWKRKDHKERAKCTRQYRTLWLEVPRKNGKSVLASAIANVLLFIDKEPGGQIYSAAADGEQALIVFNAAKAMRDAEPELVLRSTAYKKSLVHNATGTVYRPISSAPETKHGFNVSGFVIDEVHVHKSRDLIDVLETGTGARRQPLKVYITTAGVDRQSIAYEKHGYAKKVIVGAVNDETFLPFIFAAGEKDDWTKPATWRKANPNLGVSVKLEYIEHVCKEAQETPGLQNAFRRLHLNQWTEQVTRWLDMRRWNRCKTPLPDLTGKSCFAGLDLASTIDVTAFVMVFPPQSADPLWYLLPRFWVPEDTLRERVRRDHVAYDVWAKQGYLDTTPGDVTDYDVIRGEINRLGEQYYIKEIAADRWNATQLITQLDGDGFEVVPYGQGFASYSAPTKKFQILVNSQALGHGDHPVLSWMAGNVAVKQDAAGNLKPDKARSQEKIDGIAGALMGLGRAIVEEGGTVISDDYEVAI